MVTYESMLRDLAPLSLSVAALVVFIVMSASVPADPDMPVADHQAPSVEAGPDVTVAAGSTVNLDGSSSRDNVGIVDWMWSLEYAGAPVSFGGERALFTFDDAGTYEVTLRVTDGTGNWAEDHLTVTVVD